MRYFDKNLNLSATGVLIFFAVFLTAEANLPKPELFEEIWTITRDNFFDSNMNGVDWSSSYERFMPPASEAKTKDDFSEIVNEMLGELNTSHTLYYTSEEAKYYQLAGIFWQFLEPKLESFLDNGEPNYSGIGIFSRREEGKIFIEGVFEGFPAALSGLRVGDEILSVDGQPFRQIRSFAGKAGQPVVMTIRRSLGAEEIPITIVPIMIDPRTMFLDAMKNSIEIVEHNEASVGYIRIWCYAGRAYADQLEEELGSRLQYADAVVIDLRNGYGGFGPAALRPFFMPQISYTWKSRNGESTTSLESWTKPVCLLVDGSTTSGKEMQTYYFKKFKRGPVVGTKTAGKVMAGRPFILSDGSLLFLAVGGGTIDGVNLEKNGVIPDLHVPFDLKYANGEDPQKQSAIKVCSELVLGVESNLNP